MRSPRLRAGRPGKATSCLAFVGIFEIRVAVHAIFVEAQQASRFFVAQATFANGRFHAAPQPRDHLLGLVLDVVQNFANRIALDHFFQHDFAFGAEPCHMHRVRQSLEQVVQIPQDFLVGADEECAEIVVLAVVGMKRQGALHVTAVDKLIDFAIGITGNIAEHGVLRRLFIEAMDRQHRKELLDRPAIWHALEKREIAEVGIGKRRVDAFEFLGEKIQLASQLLDLAADRPVHVFRHAALLERQIAEAEEIEGRIERLLRVA